MKKTLLLLMIISALALSGCARQPILLPQPQNTGLRAAPAILGELPSGGHPLQIGGVVVTPPLSLKKVQSLGFTVDVGTETVQSDALSEVYTITGYGVEFDACFYNQTDDALPVASCPLTVVLTTDFVADKGIAPGATEAELLAAYGDATDDLIDGDSHWLIYGTGLYDGLVFELDARTRRLISAVSFCFPPDDVEAEQ